VHDERYDRPVASIEEIAGRLERVRGNLSDEEFARLVSDVMRVTQRFADRRFAASQRPSPSTESPPRGIRKI
jgi:hypothetical protein